MLLYINYPSWLHPEIIPGFRFLRWYGFMYLVAFFVAYLFFKFQVNRGELETVCKQKKKYDWRGYFQFVYVWNCRAFDWG